MSAVTVGVCVAGGVGIALLPGGRRASALGPGRTAPSMRVRWARMRGWPGGSRRGDAFAEGEVRVLVAQVTSLLRAGAPTGAAWTRAAGVRVDGLGVPDERGLADVAGVGPARAVVAATRLALNVGAPLGRVLESVSDALAADAEARAERDAALAGPRTTARVLLWLPAAGTLLGWALGADPLAAATDGGFGTAAVCAGVVLLALGRWWTGRLVEAARRAGES